MTDEEQKELSISLFNAGTFKYGTFYTKTECQLNSYFDLLAVLGNPSLMDKICDQSSKLCKDGNIDFNSLCGVTYGGMPFAVLMALKLQKPLLMWRKEISCHPNQPRIIGKIAENEYCLVVEEVTCSGNSILEVIKDIEDTGMLVRDVFTIIDLEQGASENFKKLGYNLHSLIKMSRLAQILYDENLISADRRKSICEGFSSIFAPNGDCITGTNLGIKKSMPYEARIDLCKSKVAQKLFKLMLRKKSNLSVDFTTNKLDTLVHVVDIIGPFICILVLHLDVFEDFEETKFHNLKRIATKHDFLIMDDRKISEYEDVMKVQCSKIFKFVDLLTIHAICGEVTMRTIQSLATKFPENGVFIVTYPNCSNSLLTAGYEKNAINATVEFFEEASGFMCWKISEVPLGYVHMVLDNNKISKTNSKRIKNTICYPSDTLVSEICADIVLSYYDDLENIEELVKKKQSLLWNAYLKRVNMNIVR